MCTVSYVNSSALLTLLQHVTSAASVTSTVVSFCSQSRNFYIEVYLYRTVYRPTQEHVINLLNGLISIPCTKDNIWT